MTGSENIGRIKPQPTGKLPANGIIVFFIETQIFAN
jgi:hypothetical protein